MCTDGSIMQNSKNVKNTKFTDSAVDKTSVADSKSSLKITSKNTTNSSVKPDDVERRDGPGSE